MSGLIDPAEGGIAISPSDNTNLLKTGRGIYIGVAGDLTVGMLDGTTLVFTELAAGVIHPLRVKRVYATGTTATNIVVVY